MTTSNIMTFNRSMFVDEKNQSRSVSIVDLKKFQSIWKQLFPFFGSIITFMD